MVEPKSRERNRPTKNRHRLRFYYGHSGGPQRGMERLIEEVRVGKWVVWTMCRTGHWRKDDAGRPVYMQFGVSPKTGRLRTSPRIHILHPGRTHYESPGYVWRKFDPNADDGYLQPLTNTLGIEPRWTADGKDVKFFRINPMGATTG